MSLSSRFSLWLHSNPLDALNNMPEVYRIFDLNLASRFPFRTPLPTGDGNLDFTFELVERPPEPIKWSDSRPVFNNSHIVGVQENYLTLYTFPGFEVIRIAENLSFFVRDDRIECHIEDNRFVWLAELAFLGIVCAFWLERRGLVVLHSAAVSLDEAVTGFLGDNGAGKSSIAASMLEAGADFFTDDVLPVEDQYGTFSARPSYPSLRLWPKDALRHSRKSDLETVQPGVTKQRGEIGTEFPGSFSISAGPLHRLLVLDRRKGLEHISFDDLAPSEAVIELVRNSFIPRMVMSMGWQPRRLDLFAQLLKRVSVKRLVYPDGIEHLPRVRDAILTAHSHDT